MVMLFHACLTHLSVVCLFLSEPSWPPADRANVLRALSSPSPHRLEQTGTKNFTGVYERGAERRERTVKAVFMTSFMLL